MPMAGQVLVGLEQIHDLGYLHRDISPKRELCGELQSAPANWGITYEARTDIGTRKVNQDNLMVDGLFYYEGTDFRRNGIIDCRSDEIHMAAVCDGVGDRTMENLLPGQSFRLCSIFWSIMGQARLCRSV